MPVVGDDQCFLGATSRSFNEIKQSESRINETIAEIEVPSSRSLHWMEPEDTADAFLGSLHSGTKTSHSRGFQVVMLDGAARFLSNSIGRQTLDSLTFLSVPSTGAEY